MRQGQKHTQANAQKAIVYWCLLILLNQLKHKLDKRYSCKIPW